VAGIKSEYLAGMPRNLHAAALVEALSDGFGDVLVQGRNPLPLPSGVKSGLLGHFFYCRAGSEYDGWLRSTASRIECDQSRRATPPSIYFLVAGRVRNTTVRISIVLFGAAWIGCATCICVLPGLRPRSTVISTIGGLVRRAMMSSDADTAVQEETRNAARTLAACKRWR
jgi:hypothetical protein